MHGRDVSLFDRFAPLYDLFMPSADAGTLERGLALAERDVDRVLDVAGGTGRAVSALAAPTRVVVDAAPGMLRQAAGAGLGAVVGDAGGLPIRPASVDAVVVVDALHHVGTQQAALEEARRVLRPGGVLVVREFDPTTLRGRGLVAAERLVGFDSQFHDPDALAEMADGAGLRATIVERGFGYTMAGVRPTDDAA
jgi:ubiquinone/menaquinone biosynthesis C-methylase UbiE